LIIRTINRALNLRSGDLARGAPFFLYYFLIIASYSMGQVAGDALFMEQFKAVELPYADIAIAVLVGFVVALYLRACRHTELKNVLSVCLLSFAVMASVFWWAAHYTKWRGLFPLLYVWVGIFGVLATMQVWTLANVVWTTREAKRLFSLLGSGGIVGGIFGGFLGTFAVKRFGTESLLLIISFFLVLCTILVQIIWRQQKTQNSPGESAETHGPRESNLMESFRVIRDSGLLQTIAVLICLSSIVTTAASWQLKAIAKESFMEKDALAAFLSTFRGSTGVLALAAQLFVTSRILRRFGVGAALFILPLLLMVGSVGLLTTGSLAAVTLLKASDKVFRYSVDTSALQLLYLPIPSRVKLQAKSFIDTVIWRLGDGLAGFTVLLFAAVLHFTPQQIALPNLAFLVVWIGVAAYARKQYVGTLSINMQQLQLSPEHNTVPILDALTTTVLVEKLNSKDPSEVLYALDLFKMGEEHRSHEAVLKLLDHPNPDIRTKTIAVLDEVGDKDARTLVANLLKDEHIGVRTEALLYLSQHDHIDPLEQIEAGGDFEEYSVRSGIVAYLSRLGGDENLEGARVILDAMVREDGAQGQRTRLEAARLIANLPSRFEPQLGQLLQDNDKEVVRCAMRAAAVQRRRRWAPLLVERLSDPELHYDAVEAILSFGEAIAGTLRDYLGDESVPIEIRREIPPVLLRLGTPVAVRILANNVIQGDNVLRYRIISALNKLFDVHKDVEMDADSIETVLVAEIMGYYRSCQLLEVNRGDGVELKETMKQDLERIFRLMKLLSPEHSLQDAYRGLQSRDPVTHANALEYLDNTLKPQLRTLLVPLIDSDVSNAERARLANRLLGLKADGNTAAPFFGRMDA